VNTCLCGSTGRKREREKEDRKKEDKKKTGSMKERKKVFGYSGMWIPA
jgi:hypothetical protein